MVLAVLPVPDVAVDALVDVLGVQAHAALDALVDVALHVPGATDVLDAADALLAVEVVPVLAEGVAALVAVSVKMIVAILVNLLVPKLVTPGAVALVEPALDALGALSRVEVLVLELAMVLAALLAVILVVLADAGEAGAVQTATVVVAEDALLAMDVLMDVRDVREDVRGVRLAVVAVLHPVVPFALVAVLAHVTADAAPPVLQLVLVLAAMGVIQIALLDVGDAVAAEDVALDVGLLARLDALQIAQVALERVHLDVRLLVAEVAQAIAHRHVYHNVQRHVLQLAQASCSAL